MRYNSGIIKTSIINTTMSQTNEVKDIINLLQELDISTSFNVFVPSQQKEAKFKQLTTEQLKRLLKTIIDSPIYNTEFILTFNTIIKENCLDTNLDINLLTIYDKLLIFFKTRLESISQEYTFNFTDEEILEHNLSEKSKTINLEEHFCSFANKQITFLPDTIQYNDCIVTCDIPTILTENKLEKELHKNIKLEVSTPEELREIIGETFINEVTKFIINITVNDKEINLQTQNFKTRISIIENLPTTLINKVIKYIEQYRNNIKELISYKVPVLTTNNTTVYIEKDFPLDASFFNM